MSAVRLWFFVALVMMGASSAEAQALAAGSGGGEANRPSPFAAFSHVEWNEAPLPMLGLKLGSSAPAKADGATPVARAAAASSYMVTTEVQVDGGAEAMAPGEGAVRTFTAEQVERSAGTFGDPSRFLQTLAGVVSDNDQRNDFLVRGGNPAENLFVIDNIEVPSINQLALSDTTGGFASMLDPAAVQQMTLHTDAYDERFEQRLSSVVEVSTRPTGRVERRRMMEAGIGGMGGSMTMPLAGGSLFVSARQGVLQYLTNDIGMNGVPHYRNIFVRADGRTGEHDTWWGMSLTGIDSIHIEPHTNDPEETNPYVVQYSGWRNTTGLNWQHVFSAKQFAVASVSNAEQSQSVQMNTQVCLNDECKAGLTTGGPYTPGPPGSTIYNEQTSDGITTAKYDWVYEPTHALTVAAGGRASVDRMDYDVQQPYGLQNPYSSSPAPTNAMGLGRRFAATESGEYVQAIWKLVHGAQLTVGERGQQWSLGGHDARTAKSVFSVPVLGRNVHVGYAEYAQMPATLYLLSYDNVRTLRPIRSQQLTAGAELLDTRRARASLQVYQKRYLDYPVAAAYPQLSLANVADTFGTAFLIFPMVGQGKGLARGAELTVETHVSARTDVTATVAYARSWYSGLDGVLRRGNYDLPFVANVTGVRRMGRSMALSWKYSVRSGLPYTPDDMALSYAQNRDVYDLNQVNGRRSWMFQRLDVRVERSFTLGAGTMTWHAGLENALDHHNFASYMWQPNKGGVSEQNQMPLFPDGGVKYVF